MGTAFGGNAGAGFRSPRPQIRPPRAQPDRFFQGCRESADGSVHSRRLLADASQGSFCDISRWPAGGHLASMALSHRRVKAGIAISGIYDLEPIRHSYLNVKLGLDGAMSRRNSPVMQPGGAMKPLALVAGAAELPLLRRQTADFACHRAKYGLPVTYEEIPGADHFTIMHEMMSPTGRITALIRELV